jgi:hypothetical protein
VRLQNYGCGDLHGKKPYTYLTGTGKDFCVERTKVSALRRRITKRGKENVEGEIEQKQKKENMTRTQIQVHNSSVALLLAR